MVRHLNHHNPKPVITGMLSLAQHCWSICPSIMPNESGRPHLGVSFKESLSLGYILGGSPARTAARSSAHSWLCFDVTATPPSFLSPGTPRRRTPCGIFIRCPGGRLYRMQRRQEDWERNWRHDMACQPSRPSSSLIATARSSARTLAFASPRIHLASDSLGQPPQAAGGHTRQSSLQWTHP